MVWWWLMVSQHTKHSPWGPAAGGSLTECRGELATAGTGLWGHGGWCVCVKGWEGGREGAIERCERGQTAGSAAAAFLVRGLGDKLVGALGCQPRQLRARFVSAAPYQERRADGRGSTNGWLLYNVVKEGGSGKGSGIVSERRGMGEDGRGGFRGSASGGVSHH